MVQIRVSGLTTRFLVLVLVSISPILGFILFRYGWSTGLLVAVGLSLVASSIGCFLVTERLSLSLDRFARMLERFAKGDFSSRVYPPRIAELADLSGSFNTMASRVQKRLDALSRLSGEQDAILRGMIEGVVTVDNDGRIRRVNDAARSLLDIPVKECEGRLVEEVIHHAELQRFVAQSLKSSSVRTRVISLHGPQERIVEVYTAPLVDSEAAATGTLFVFHDTTRIQKLENVRRDFVANVSHELRTPITSIKGFVETLMDGAMNEPESLRKFLGIIAKHSDRLNAIFSDLLVLAQLEARDEDEELGLEECSIARVAQAAVDACSLRAAEREAHVTIEIDAELKVLAKENLIEQALVNLIDNAIKYSEPRVAVTVRAQEVGDMVKVSVFDTGPGIDKQHLPRLFERFYRVDQGRSRQMGGTGLGLAIVKHIAQVHGGRVEVESALGKGSVFSVFVRAVQPE